MANVKGEYIPKEEWPYTRQQVAVRPAVTDVDYPLPDFFQVEATQQGFIHWLRNPGDVFVVPKHLYSPTWMRICDREIATVVAAQLQRAGAKQLK